MGENRSTSAALSRTKWYADQWLRWLLLTCVTLFATVAHAAEIVTYHYTSPQGTVLAKADSAGNLISTADYRPYGSKALGTPEEGPG